MGCWVKVMNAPKMVNLELATSLEVVKKPDDTHCVIVKFGEDAEGIVIDEGDLTMCYNSMVRTTQSLGTAWSGR
jgi:hypothetical protein